MAILPFKGKSPRIHSTAFIAPGAHLIGDVVVGPGASIWFGAVLRGDMGALRVGANSNIQDNAVLHGDHNIPCIIKKNVIVGHQATVHACVVEDGALIGIGARVLTKARVGAGSLIGAGALVRENQKIAPGSLVVGVPAKVVRPLSPAEMAKQKLQAKRYYYYAQTYKKYLG
ncbi:MAG: gamma carbonic anhydrase family protein [Candidatus Omnitrophica bacterium]|nr:gamma carbonic anhydrase family protein [Candidatus Omnitrophota bacterium]